MMNPLTFTAIAAGRVALGAAFNGPAISHVASRQEHDQTAREGASKATLAFTDRAQATAIYASILGGWLTERRAILDHQLEKDAKAMVTLKDVFIAGTVITGTACFVAEELMRRSYQNGVQLTAKGALAPEAPAGADTFRGYFKAMGTLNRVFVAGAIGATPFINFALFNDYRPNPLSKFFSL